MKILECSECGNNSFKFKYKEQSLHCEICHNEISVEDAYKKTRTLNDDEYVGLDLEKETGENFVEIYDFYDLRD